jgi:hypothetical protein
VPRAGDLASNVQDTSTMKCGMAMKLFLQSELKIRSVM